MVLSPGKAFLSTHRKMQWLYPRHLGPAYVSIADSSVANSYCKVLGIALLVRIGTLLLMALSCWLLPNFMSEDDSLVTFDLRLSSKDMLNNNTSFATMGSFCECGFACCTTVPVVSMIDPMDATTANIMGTTTNISRNNVPPLQYRFWSFLLTPLTRWDAARFLQLAHRPTIRYPQLELERRIQQWRHWDMATAEQDTIVTSSSSSSTSTSSTTCSIDIDAVVQQSEEAHPFLPFFPWMIQVAASIMMWVLPGTILPPTCESILTWAAFWLNTLCFVYATSELYKMTKILAFHSMTQYTYTTNHKPLLLASTTTIEIECHCQARHTALLFVINPATFFFGTSYSESLASALIFQGCRWMLQHQTTRTNNPQYNTFRYYMGAITMWWIACWVRSNGSLLAGFLVLYGLGRTLSVHTSSSSSSSIMRRSISFLSGIAMGSLLLLGGVGLHNYYAVSNHCTRMANSNLQGTDASCDYNYQPPKWCNHGRFFNLYSYVQRKYWNVGLFRYYEWKQIPNFFLATPVLLFSSYAVMQWIHKSWTRANPNPNISYKGKDHRRGIVYQFINWIVYSLRLFVNDIGKVPISNQRDTDWSDHPITLGYYAILAVSVLLSLTVAHVQIATRLICSTCPAFYWSLIRVIHRGGIWADAIVMWCLLYLVLGVILHPNWLPWT